MALLVHALWQTDPSGQNLTSAVVERLGPYLTRYGQTLKTVILAIGGDSDHLHVLWEATPMRPVASVTEELQRTSARFVRDVLNVVPFAWRDAVVMRVLVPPTRKN